MDIYIVDDHHEFRKSLKLYLTLRLKHNVIGEAKDGDEFLADNNAYFADVILMDINMPNINGLCATKWGTWKNSKFRIIAITMSCDGYGLHEIISAGFKGFICKDNVFDEIGIALDKVNKGGFYFTENMKI